MTAQFTAWAEQHARYVQEAIGVPYSPVVGRVLHPLAAPRFYSTACARLR